MNCQPTTYSPPKVVNVEPSTKPKGKGSLYGFNHFWNHYHKITGLSKTDKEAAKKKWKRLNLSEKRKAYSKVKLYFISTGESRGGKFIKKARTYLEDRAFEDEFRKPSTYIKDINLSTWEQDYGHQTS